MTRHGENIPAHTKEFNTSPRGNLPVSLPCLLSHFCLWSLVCGVCGVFIVRRRLSESVPGAGSFIRPNKTHDGRISFLHALQQKYSSSPEKYQEIVLESSGKQIEMIGFDKIEKQQSSAPNLSVAILFPPAPPPGCCCL